ncbi:hypothetical protein [Flavobacterium beibuense]|uniref:Secreted protein n=1 Tax=Flavobacterium beibuense TaxID=657326 RepID=A0A444WGU7_9FLAO|nr:hypothetical protein [Flavobacterium beibuense]RYJ45081.1 Secreted protein [Flavobacterium beibuense]
MRYLFILFLFLCISPKVMAQGGDKPQGGIAIPREKDPQVSPEPSKEDNTPSIFTIKPPKKELDPRFQIGVDKTDTSPMIIEKQYADSGENYEDRVKIRQQGESSEAYKGNQFLGEIRTKSEYINSYVADFGLQDGDRIRVWINDHIVISDFVLTNNSSAIQIRLQPGFNKIEFEALNQGTTGPNTADIRIVDDQKDVLHSSQWNLATGFRAKVIVVKEDATEGTTVSKQ